jgi:hypothetical protein
VDVNFIQAGILVCTHLQRLHCVAYGTNVEEAEIADVQAALHELMVYNIPCIPSNIIIYQHIPSYTIAYIHIPSFAIIYQHMPSYTTM